MMGFPWGTFSMRALPWVMRRCVLLVLLLQSGCGPKDGLSDYDRMKKGQQDAGASLKEMGAKLTEVHRPQGDSWSVSLSGLQITDDLLSRIKKVGRITELDLSKSTVTDDQLARINEVEIGSLLVRLDLSGTAVTDAGLDKLTNLVVLSSLNLTGTKVTPAGVERFKKKRQDDPKIMGLFKSPTIRLK